ncbi:MAG: ATP-binding cassette domain-containing protein, partial [Sphingomonadaceae bacterium]|jgi:iron complex transport system ATP-binding protein
MICLQDLRVDLGGKTVLQPLSLNLPRGQVTAVIGPNGAGKSSLMRAIARL